jgi:hypothetical protein
LPVTRAKAIARLRQLRVGELHVRRRGTVRQREAELADLRGRIEYDVRSALLDLRATEQQLEASPEP